jgi:hypothetical protein
MTRNTIRLLLVAVLAAFALGATSSPTDAAQNPQGAQNAQKKRAPVRARHATRRTSGVTASGSAQRTTLSAKRGKKTTRKRRSSTSRTSAAAAGKPAVKKTPTTKPR